jgi:hypothetical protein
MVLFHHANRSLGTMDSEAMRAAEPDPDGEPREGAS